MHPPEIIATRLKRLSRSCDSQLSLFTKMSQRADIDAKAAKEMKIFVLSASSAFSAVNSVEGE